MKDRTAEPEAVPEMAKTSGDIRSRWEWVEAVVWTERMLTALEEGVEGGKWYSMMDNGREVRAAPGRESEEAGAEDTRRRISTAGSTAGVGTQSGKSAEATVRNPHGTGPGGSGSNPCSIGTDLRTGLCGTQLWVSSGAGLQGCAGSSRQPTETRIHMGGRCGSEQLF